MWRTTRAKKKKNLATFLEDVALYTDDQKDKDPDRDQHLEPEQDQDLYQDIDPDPDIDIEQHPDQHPDLDLELMYFLDFDLFSIE